VVRAHDKHLRLRRIRGAEQGRILRDIIDVGTAVVNIVRGNILRDVEFRCQTLLRHDGVLVRGPRIRNRLLLGGSCRNTTLAGLESRRHVIDVDCIRSERGHVGRVQCPRLHVGRWVRIVVLLIGRRGRYRIRCDRRRRPYRSHDDLAERAANVFSVVDFDVGERVVRFDRVDVAHWSAIEFAHDDVAHWSAIAFAHDEIDQWSAIELSHDDIAQQSAIGSSHDDIAQQSAIEPPHDDIAQQSAIGSSHDDIAQSIVLDGGLLGEHHDLVAGYFAIDSSSRVDIAKRPAIKPSHIDIAS
jgi:hypothetical protein